MGLKTTTVELVGKRLLQPEEKCREISVSMIRPLLFQKLGKKTRVRQNCRLSNANWIFLGVYRCLVDTIDGETHSSAVELKVGGYFNQCL